MLMVLIMWMWCGGGGGFAGGAATDGGWRLVLVVLVAAAAVAEAGATGLALTVVLCVVVAACTLPARFPPSRSLRDPRLLAVCTVLPPAAGSDRRGRPSADDHRRRDEHGGGLPMDCGRFDGAGITADVVVAKVADTPSTSLFKHHHVKV